MFGGSKNTHTNNAWAIFNSLCVWDGSNFEAKAPNCFLPVHRIHSLFTAAYVVVDEVKLMTVCPIQRRVSILPVH